MTYNIDHIHNLFNKPTKKKLYPRKLNSIDRILYIICKGRGLISKKIL